MGNVSTISPTILRGVESCSFSVTLADAREEDTPLIYVNEAFEDLTGYGRDEALGRNCRFLQGDDTQPASVTLIRDAIDRNRSVTSLLLNYRKDGTKFWNRFQLSPVTDADGDVIAFLGIQIDLTRDMSVSVLERERQKLESLGTLAGGVAHELNNALQPIILMEEMLEDLVQDLPDAKRATAMKCLASIKDHATFAGSIVSDVLSFARKGDGVPEPADAEEILKDAINFAVEFLPSAIKVNIHQLSDAQAKASILCTRNTAIQVFTNLFSNAAFAMNGRGQIDVSTKLIDVDMELSDSLDIRPGAYVRIDVSDHGEGMSEEIVRQVFDPFFTTREVGVGTGLGLSTVYGIVRDWGGTVSVQSAVGEGTTFSVMVPCVT